MLWPERISGDGTSVPVSDSYFSSSLTLSVIVEAALLSIVNSKDGSPDPRPEGALARTRSAPPGKEFEVDICEDSTEQRFKLKWFSSV